MQIQKYPEVIVGAIIIYNNSEILLLKSNKWCNKYAIPGGHIEIGETAEEALIREVKEETGINIFNINFLGFQDGIFSDIYFKKKHFLFLDFFCNARSNEVRLNRESQDYIWINSNNAINLPLVSYTKEALTRFNNL